MVTPHTRARILIVEDNPPIQMLLRHLLAKHFDVELAHTVDGALLRAERHRFDLFLLDINLGEDRSGVDLLDLLREMPAYSTTPAVACTAYVGQHYEQHFLAHGFSKHIDKPFSRPVLLEAIEELLGSGASSGNTEFSLQTARVAV